MDLSEIPIDIEAGVHITTVRPVEKFVFKWEINNYLKFFHCTDEVKFSTAKDVLRWKISFNNYGGKCKNIQLTLLTEVKSLLVNYTSSIIAKDGASHFQKCGELKYTKVQGIVSERIFNIPDFLFGYRDKLLYFLPNDILTFQCIMFLRYHSMTSIDVMPSPKISKLQNLSRNLKDLLQRQEHCDFSLHVGEEQFPVHKAVLCARSPVFDKMFKHSMIEGTQNHLDICDLDINTIRDFIPFLYTGELESVSWEKALNLYYAADKYEVDDLRKACSEYLKYNLSINQVCKVLMLADRHGDEELKNAAKNFVQIHSYSVKETDDWLQLVKMQPRLAVEVLD